MIKFKSFRRPLRKWRVHLPEFSTAGYRERSPTAQELHLSGLKPIIVSAVCVTEPLLTYQKQNLL
jgi:hypothetical protein